MEKDLLQAVIKVESEIQKSIESERGKAADWLESVRVSQSQELESKKQQLAEQYTQGLAETCQECRLKAEKDISDGNEMAEHLQNLPDESMQDVVSAYLTGILPEKQR